ncbi:MAG: copper amine oxidase [Paenibacillus sp.]|nr:copper amine oxidase [Paenibacillus sp.]
MKKGSIPFLFLALFIIALPHPALTSNRVEITLLPFNLTASPNKAPLPLDGPLLNYDGKAYAPVRALVESMGGQVSYQENERNIEILPPMPRSKKSAVSSIKKQGDFTLFLHSGKQTYASDETLDIWGTFMYSGEQEVTIGHGAPILMFYITDAEGNMSGDSTQDFLKEEPMGTNTVFTSSLSWNVLMNMNFMKSGVSDFHTFHAANPEPWLLDQGEYTVGIVFRNLIDGELVTMETKIGIEVKEGVQ